MAYIEITKNETAPPHWWLYYGVRERPIGFQILVEAQIHRSTQRPNSSAILTASYRLRKIFPGETRQESESVHLLPTWADFKN